MQLSLRHAVFFWLFLAQCIAIPSTKLHDDSQLVLSHDTASTTVPTSSSYSVTRACRIIIQWIWPQPQKWSGASSVAAGVDQPKRVRAKYGDDAVLRFRVRTQEEATAFAQALDTLFLDLWGTGGDWLDVRVAKKVLPALLDLLPPTMQQSFTPVIPDLSTAIYESLPQIPGRSWRTGLKSHMPHDLFFENYQPLNVVYPWLRQIASLFPHRTQLFTIGRSFEGRDIPVLRVGDRHGHDSTRPRPTILIISGTHAREWITASTSAYILRSLLHNFAPSHGGTVNKILRNFDLVFVPILNPDGYEYTWTTDRLWRKNRQGTALPFCLGFDLDRSFPAFWSGDAANDNPCSESYPGEVALQAVEAQRLVTWVKNETLEGRRSFAAFIDLHSYSQQILYPYSYSCDHAPHNLEDLEEAALGLSKAFRLANGHYYGVNSACQGSIFSLNSTAGEISTGPATRVKMEASGGSALDFFYQDMRVDYAFQIKLRDTGTHGFLLPRDEIVPTGLEAFEAVLRLGKWLLSKRGLEESDGDDAQSGGRPESGKLIQEELHSDEERETEYGKEAKR